LNRDKKFLEKSIEATKARNEEVEPQAQRLQVSQGINLHTDRKSQSEEELNSVIQLKGEINGLQLVMNIIIRLGLTFLCEPTRPLASFCRLPYSAELLRLFEAAVKVFSYK